MKYIYIFFFIGLVSCGSTNQTYICGERKCIDKKEFKNYFAENLTVEVLEKKKDKKKAIDLVKIGGCISIKNQAELNENFISLKNDANYRSLTGNINKKYIEDNLGATKLIMNYFIQ